MTDHQNALSAGLTRRAFCVQSCEAVSLAAVGAMLSACGGSPTSPSAAPALGTINASVANGIASVTVDAASPLGAVGAAALVQTSNSVFLVSRTSASTFTALTAICTHEACTIAGFQSPAYVCPCHGSQFNTSGAVLSGPATLPFASSRRSSTTTC